MRKSSMVVLTVLIVMGGSRIVNAQSNENIYFNKFVGLSFSVPKNWYIATDSETSDLFLNIDEYAKRVMNLDDPAFESSIDQLPGMVLLIIMDANDIQNAYLNMSIVAVNVREMKDEVPLDVDILRPLAEEYKEIMPKAIIYDIIKHNLGGKEFYRMDFTIPMQYITQYSSQLVRIHNEYIILLTASAGSDSGLTELLQIAADNLTLSTVPQAVDNSPEGVSFRNKATLEISDSSNTSSSGGRSISPIMKFIGLLLLVTGGSWLFNRVKGRTLLFFDRVEGGKRITRKVAGGWFVVKISGETFDNDDGSSRQEELSQCTEGEELQLVYDRDNFNQFAEFDRSIRVYRQNGKQIGYVHRVYSERVRTLFAGNKEVKARVFELYQKEDMKSCTIEITGK